MKPSLRHSLLLSVLFAGVTTTAYSNEAPVYDVDNYPPQFDSQNDASQQRATTSVGSPTESANMNTESQSDAPAPADNSMQAVAPLPEKPAAVMQTFVPDASLSVEQRVGRVEQQLNNMLHDDPAAKMAAMQTDVQTLRGQVEELSHQVQTLQTQQKTLYADLDKRMNRELTGSNSPSETPSAEANDTIPANLAHPKLKLAPAATLDKAATDKSAKVAPVASAPNVAEEQAIYQSAYSLIKAKKYSQAAATLQKMLQKYPSGQFASNAHYWLGELYGLLGKNDQATTEFSTVIKNYPESPKLADAQLKLGLIYAAQFKWTEAKAAFKMVTTHYAGTPSARLASEQLKQIKQAGH